MSGGCNFYFRHVVISYCCMDGREESVTLRICYGDVIPEIAANVHAVCSHYVSSSDLKLNKRRSESEAASLQTTENSVSSAVGTSDVP